MTLPILRRGGSPVRPNGGPLQTYPSHRVDPWNDADMLNRLFSNFFQSPLSLIGRDTVPVVPFSEGQIDLYENGDELLAYVFAPGLSAEGFDISAGGEMLTIKAERKPLLEVTEEWTSHTPWIGQAASAGTFAFSCALPVEIDPSRVQASYKNGVLLVRMAKSETAKPRQVKVEVSQS